MENWRMATYLIGKGGLSSSGVHGILGPVQTRRELRVLASQVGGDAAPIQAVLYLEIDIQVLYRSTA